jgi:hypothetical protein
MHEYWLQRYLKEHYRNIGFAELHGPYSMGADFKGVYAGNRVKVEAEWAYSDYITHKHSVQFADILVVATLELAPESLKLRLPLKIINLDPEKVAAWAKPRSIEKSEVDYFAYPWRKLSMNLLYLFAYYRRQNGINTDFVGAILMSSIGKSQQPEGFQFGTGGKEENFEGSTEEKAAWDYWLKAAHAAADHFKLKPRLLRPTWIDRVALYSQYTGKMTDYEIKRFKDLADFIDMWMAQEGQNNL